MQTGIQIDRQSDCSCEPLRNCEELAKVGVNGSSYEEMRVQGGSRGKVVVQRPGTRWLPFFIVCLAYIPQKFLASFLSHPALASCKLVRVEPDRRKNNSCFLMSNVVFSEVGFMAVHKGKLVFKGSLGSRLLGMQRAINFFKMKEFREIHEFQAFRPRDAHPILSLDKTSFRKWLISRWPE